MFSRSRPAPLGITAISAVTIGTILMVMAGSASANRVTLVATINNQSILEPVSWAVFKLDGTNTSSKPVAELERRHSGTVYLDAGRYRATVTQEHIRKEAIFKVEANVDKTITIALD